MFCIWFSMCSLCVSYAFLHVSYSRFYVFPIYFLYTGFPERAPYRLRNKCKAGVLGALDEAASRPGHVKNDEGVHSKCKKWWGSPLEKKPKTLGSYIVSICFAFDSLCVPYVFPMHFYMFPIVVSMYFPYIFYIHGSPGGFLSLEAQGQRCSALRPGRGRLQARTCENWWRSPVKM